MSVSDSLASTSLLAKDKAQILTPGRFVPTVTDVRLFLEGYEGVRPSASFFASSNGVSCKKKGSTSVVEQPTEHRTSALARLLEPVGRCLTPEVAKALVNLRADPAVQNRIDELADKCTEGTLSAVEQSEYETYMRAIDFIGVLQAQARSLLESNGTT